MANILIAEDEERISRFIQKGLRASGYETTVVENGPDALHQAATGIYDLLVLDMGLPGMDGFQVLDQLRRDGSGMPVIMCTARDSVEDTVQGLDSGADDYLAKPFRFAELLARVKARLRQSIPAGDDSGRISCGTLILDIGRRCAVIDEQEIALSAREFSMAQVFIENPGQVLTRELLLDKVWGYDFQGASNVVDVYVRYLRHKIGAERIITVRGVGYRLAEI